MHILFLFLKPWEFFNSNKKVKPEETSVTLFTIRLLDHSLMGRTKCAASKQAQSNRVQALFNLLRTGEVRAKFPKRLGLRSNVLWANWFDRWGTGFSFRVVDDPVDNLLGPPKFNCDANIVICLQYPHFDLMKHHAYSVWSEYMPWQPLHPG